MVLENGDKLRAVSGRAYRVSGEHGSGGQARVYRARELDSGREVALKLFHPVAINAHAESRSRFLIDRSLRGICTALCAPDQLFHQGSEVGHVAPWAAGAPLEDFLAEPPRSLTEHVQLALALAHAVDVLHRLQLAHGDLHSGNLLVEVVDNVLRLSVIDLDNFQAPGQAAAPCIGHLLYMAPELHQGRAIPGIAADLFSLAVLLHEILLHVHPFGAGTKTPAEFAADLPRGWLYDPQRPITAAAQGHYDTRILDHELARLFRTAFSREPSARPSAAEWSTALKRALTHVFVCPRADCGYPTIIDSSKQRCPGCDQRYPLLEVSGRAFRCAVEAGAVPLGRAQLGDETVSSQHVVLRRIGPETWLEPLNSLNGTHRRIGATWKRLQPGVPVALYAGDRLRLGNVELSIQEVP